VVVNMLEITLNFLNSWNNSKNDRQKLQHALLTLSVLIILVAGIIGLFNSNIGHKTVHIAGYTAATYLANAVVWNLLQSSLIIKLSTKPRRK
jgi:hypothetical protein